MLIPFYLLVEGLVQFSWSFLRNANWKYTYDYLYVMLCRCKNWWVQHHWILPGLIWPRVGKSVEMRYALVVPRRDTKGTLLFFFIYKTNVTFYVLELFSNLFYSYIIWLEAQYILLAYGIDDHIGFSFHSSPDSLMKNNAYYSLKFFYTIIILKFCEL